MRFKRAFEKYLWRLCKTVVSGYLTNPQFPTTASIQIFEHNVARITYFSLTARDHNSRTRSVFTI